MDVFHCPEPFCYFRYSFSTVFILLYNRDSLRDMLHYVSYHHDLLTALYAIPCGSS